MLWQGPTIVLMVFLSLLSSVLPSLLPSAAPSAPRGSQRTLQRPRDFSQTFLLEAPRHGASLGRRCSLVLGASGRGSRPWSP